MNEELKMKAASIAMEFVKDGMVIGLGTGSTAECFIDLLAHEVNKGLNVKVVVSSDRTLKLALEKKFKVIDINEVEKIDLTVDGADEIDRKKNLIKGGGGALLREKFLALSSEKLIIIADGSKKVSEIGKGKIPVEIVPFGSRFTKKRIDKLGFESTLRIKDDKSPFITDNHNYILDLTAKSFFSDIKQLHLSLKLIPGVIETGIFFKLDPKIIIVNSLFNVQVID